MAADIRRCYRDLGLDSTVRVTRNQVRDMLNEVLPRRSSQLFLNVQREEFIRRISGLVEQGGQGDSRRFWMRYPS